jgi:hypothetical protein
VTEAKPIDGIPTVAALDALFSAATEMTPHQLAFVIHRGQYARLLTLPMIERTLESTPGRRGATRIRRAVELRLDESVGTRCRTEDILLPYATTRFGEPHVNVFGIAGIPDYEPDFCWPEQRWIIEVDGDQHTEDPNQARKDRDRDEVLRQCGWIVVRVPWRDVWDVPAAVIRSAARRFGV